MADDRVVIPSPLPSPHVENPACRTTRSALLVFKDGDTIDSPIECVHKFEITDEVMASCVDPAGQPIDPSRIAYSVVRSAVLPTGEFVTDVRVTSTESDGEPGLYLVVLDNALTRVESCAHVADSQSTNEVLVEDLGQGRSGPVGALRGHRRGVREAGVRPRKHLTRAALGPSPRPPVPHRDARP